MDKLNKPYFTCDNCGAVCKPVRIEDCGGHKVAYASNCCEDTFTVHEEDCPGEAGPLPDNAYMEDKNDTGETEIFQYEIYEYCEKSGGAYTPHRSSIITAKSHEEALKEANKRYGWGASARQIEGGG